MPLRLEAIVAKKAVVPIPTADLMRQLMKYGADVLHEMETYPPKMPWKNPPPKTGVRRGGNRTGSYKKHWSLNPLLGQMGIEVSNRIPYAGFVGGYKGRGSKSERQTRVMAGRGWPSITDVAKDRWMKHLGAIQGTFKRRR